MEDSLQLKLLYKLTGHKKDLLIDNWWSMAQLGIPLLRHNFREANSVVHLLARDSIKLKLMNKTIIHHASTQLVEAALKDDADGRSYGRLISEHACNRLASMGTLLQFIALVLL
uniref:Uncharacterized protein LOC104240045 n=1 Tax=Nicotiana sylvestris TaxID=4096 RepID=A0A1U7Y1M8_NICSY|nr:PREDICTED: uncharacterized protein LOC104240045 [Nicotiana sylvestris]